MDSYSIDQLPCPAFAVSDSGQITSFNLSLCEMVGATAGTLADAPVTRLLTTASKILYETNVFPLLKLKGRIDEIYFNLRHADGKSRPVLVCATRVTEGDIGISRFVCLPFTERERYEGQIHTARRAAEAALESEQPLKDARSAIERQSLALDRHLAALEQRNAELEQVTHLLFHDLAEPLRKIRVFADILAENNPNPDALVRLVSAAARMDALLHAIEAYTAIGQEPLAIDSIALAPLMSAALERARRARPEVQCEAQFPALPVIEADSTLIAQLFEHIFDNALKFHEPERPLLVAVNATRIEKNLLHRAPDSYHYGDVVRLEITDNGKGFDQSHASGLFKLMGKLDRHSEGSGCGLAICRKIASLHYGSIDIFARIGVGTQVTVELPVRRLEPSVGSVSP